VGGGVVGTDSGVIALPASVRILVWSEPVDLRRGFDGLSALVRNAGEDVYSGHLYVFLSRRKNRVKALTWQRGGFLVVYKRLDRGRFHLALGDAPRVSLDAAELALLLDGVDLRRIPRPATWIPPSRREKGIDKAIAM
jgi:transposase